MSLITQQFSVHIQTNRIYVRPYTTEDFEAYFAYIMDRELQQRLGLRDVKDRASAWATFDWLRENRLFLALEERETRTVIGHIALHPPCASLLNSSEFIDKKGFSLSLAIAAHKRRKGLMEEALRALIQELFESGAVDYFDYEFEQTNAASDALRRKLGFRDWGRELFEGEELILSVLEKE